MKKLLLMLSVVALFASCDKDDSQGTTDGLYVTSSDGEQLISGASVVYYEGDNTLVINGFSFTPNLSTTTLAIVGVSEDSTTSLSADGITSYYEFMTMGASGEISDLSCTINGSRAELEFAISAAMMGASGSASDYPCRYTGAITIEEGSYEGLYMTAEDGTPSLLSNVEVSYNTSTNILTVTKFAFSATAQFGYTEDLEIETEYSLDTYYTLATISGDDIVVTGSMFVTDSYPINDLSGYIIQGEKAQFTFTLKASSSDVTYTCSYIGDITVTSDAI